MDSLRAAERARGSEGAELATISSASSSGIAAPPRCKHVSWAEAQPR